MLVASSKRKQQPDTISGLKTRAFRKIRERIQIWRFAVALLDVFKLPGVRFAVEFHRRYSLTSELVKHFSIGSSNTAFIAKGLS
jgi:hypothetical protein